MSWSKRQVILQALEEIGIHQYEYDSTAEDLQNALRTLDNMMGVWINSGIIFEPQYPLTTNLDATDIDADTNAPFEALDPMCLMLAIRLAPSYGKAVSIDTKVQARQSYTALLRNYIKGFEQSLGRFLKGAAAKRPLYPWNENSETQAEINMAAENKAENVTLEDVLDFYVSLNVEGALAELGPLMALASPLPEYANNAAAISGGLAVGNFYRATDSVNVVHS